MKTQEFTQYLDGVNSNFLAYTDSSDMQEKLAYVAKAKSGLILDRFCEMLGMNKSDDHIVSNFIYEMIGDLEFDNLIKMNLLTADELDTWLANVPMDSDQE